MLNPLIMVASNNNVVVTKVRSVNNNDTIRNRSNSPHTNKSAHQFPRKVVITAAAVTTEGANQIQQDTEFHDSVSSSAAIAALPIPKDNNSNINNNSNSHLRRVHSGNLSQSKRNNPNSRRSIFGQYFQDKPRSSSANHLVRGQGQQQRQLPPPPITPQHPLPHQQQQQQQIPKKIHLRRSSSSSSASSSGSTTSGDFHNPQQEDNSNDNNNHSYRHFDHRPVDYRVFAPSREQSATSAICNRFQELNKEYEHDYESLLERQITEHSLPPFPSPLRRFCSETTTSIMAGTGAAAVTVGDSSCFLPSSRSSSSSITVNGTYNDSSGDMHHYCGGVYSLLTPVSILRPAKYSISSNDNNNNNESTDSTSDENFTEQNETGEQQQLPPSAPVSSSFNVPRSFQGPSTTLKNFAESTASAAASVYTIDEEKKENDNLTTIISATTTTTPSNYKGLSEDFCDVVDSEEKMEQEEEEEQRRELQQGQQQRIRFDPRVTVTEFEDSIRKWYEEEELEQLKREAITLAQSYLRQHPAVAKWYQTAKLDLVTKTYRKKALYSLPVFSSSYSNNAVEEELSPNITKTDNIQSVSSSLSPSFQQVDELNPSSVKKILIVEPHPAIASLFTKSMKSMFPSAELTTALSGEQASQMIKQSFIPSDNKNRSTSTTTGVDIDTTASYDIIIVEQILTPKATTSQSNNNRNSNKPNIFQGLIDTLLNKNTNHEESKAASVSCEIRYGSELIELISKLMAQQQQDHNNDRSSSCLIIGVSFQPDRVAEKLIRSGADFVWGKPIPNVGDTLRDNILFKLLSKRNPSGDYIK
jgi:hypothetical protein